MAMCWDMRMSNLVSKKDVMDEIYNYFKKDDKMTLLVGDMGFSVLDSYFKNHPNRLTVCLLFCFIY